MYLYTVEYFQPKNPKASGPFVRFFPNKESAFEYYEELKKSASMITVNRVSLPKGKESLCDLLNMSADLFYLKTQLILWNIIEGEVK